jgi:hypothetical protein
MIERTETEEYIAKVHEINDPTRTSDTLWGMFLMSFIGVVYGSLLVVAYLVAVPAP